MIDLLLNVASIGVIVVAFGLVSAWLAPVDSARDDVVTSIPYGLLR